MQTKPFCFLLSAAPEQTKAILRTAMFGIYLYAYLSTGSAIQAQELLSWPPPVLENPTTIESRIARSQFSVSAQVGTGPMGV